MPPRETAWFYDYLSRNSRKHRYALPEPLPAGDYALVVEAAVREVGVAVAIVPVDKPARLVGTWLGAPGAAEWPFFTTTAGRSAIEGAVFLHALVPFRELVMRADKEIAPVFRDEAVTEWTEAQLIRLNPKHQMPVPLVRHTDVVLPE